MEKTSGAAVAVGSVGKQRSAIRNKKSGFTNVTERVMKYIFTVCGISGRIPNCSFFAYHVSPNRKSVKPIFPMAGAPDIII